MIVKPFSPTAIVPVDAGKELRLPEADGEIFQFTNSDFIRNKPVKKLYETDDAHVWLTTETELIEFDARAIRRYTTAQGLQPGMRRMVEDDAGNLWIGGQTSLMRLDRKGLITYGVGDNLNSARLHAINEDQDGRLYFANGDFYLSRFDGKGFQTVRPQLNADARTLWASRNAYLSRAGEWWMLTHDALYRFAHVDDFAKLNGATPRAIYDARHGLKPGGMFQIYEDARGDIWVSVRGNASDAGHGLARLRRGDEKFYTFNETDGFPEGKSASVFAEDAEGNLWIGFYEGGIARFRNNRFELFTDADGAPADLITDLHVDRAGRLWLSSSTSGLSRVDSPPNEHPRFVSFTAEQGLASNNIRTITEDAFGNIYVGTARGVDRISHDAMMVKHYSVNDGLAADLCR